MLRTHDDTNRSTALSRCKTLLGASFAALLLMASQADAAALTGTYSTGGDTTGTGPWTLTATSSTFSFVTRVTNENPTFADLTNLNAVLTSVSGGAGGGSPRFRLLLDADHDNAISGGDLSLSIYLGTSPGFVDTDATLNAFSGVNLIGNNDAGRYDTSAFAGGSPATTYADALALVGDLDVLRLGLVLDTFSPFPDRELTLTSLNGEFTATAVPEPASLKMLASGLLGGVFTAFRRNRKKA
jgi:hypothetical protein